MTWQRLRCKPCQLLYLTAHFSWESSMQSNSPSHIPQNDRCQGNQNMGFWEKGHCSRRLSQRDLFWRYFLSCGKKGKDRLILKMLTADWTPSREQGSHSPVLRKCVHLEWISLLDSIYEITIYLWVILKYLSPTRLPSSILLPLGPGAFTESYWSCWAKCWKGYCESRGPVMGAAKAARLPAQSRIHLHPGARYWQGPLPFLQERTPLYSRPKLSL